MQEQKSSSEPSAHPKGFSTERLDRARGRIAPLLTRQLIDRPGRKDNPESLTSAQVQEKCFALLGYMEEYYKIPGLDRTMKTPGDTISEAQQKTASDRRNLEQKLDTLYGSSESESQTRRDLLGSRIHEVDDKSVRSGLSEEERTDAKLNVLNRREHQKEIEARLQELLAYPQVRERFKKEFEAEFAFYFASRRPLKEARVIDQLTRKLRRGIYKEYLDNKKEHGKLTQSAADRIRYLQGQLDALEKQKTGIIETASPKTRGYLETQKLLEYKRQLKENGFVMTPSRINLLDRIRQGVLSGKKIFLVGSTGTGKSELAFNVFNEMTNGYELIPWHEGSTPRDVHGYPKISIDPATGQPYSHDEPGPYPRAKETGHGLIHGEVTGAPTRVMLQLKDTVFKDESIFQIFTGNPKDERTKQREEMDPAILRELTGIEVGYMPAVEMKDIILSILIDNNGVLKLSPAQVQYIERLAGAAEMMQKVHNREFDEWIEKQGDTSEVRELKAKVRTLLGLDPRGNTETTLNTNFLDPGTLFKLFGEWELAQARGQSFSDYMAEKLGDFIKDPKTLSTPGERVTLQKILNAYSVITSSTGDIQVLIKDQEKGYILPSEMAGGVALSDKDPMGSRANGSAQATPGQETKPKQDKPEPLPDTLRQDLMSYSIKKYAEPTGIRQFIELRDQYVSDGVATRYQVDNDKEIQEEIIRKLKHERSRYAEPTGTKQYVELRNLLVGAGMKDSKWWDEQVLGK